MGAFDYLKWTHDGAFEQHFGPGRADLKKYFPKIQLPGVVPGWGGGGGLIVKALI